MLTQGVDSDWMLHVMLLRSYLGKDFMIWGIEVPIALEGMYTLYPTTADHAEWKPPERHIRACVERTAKRAAIYVTTDGMSNLGYKVKQGSGHAALALMQPEHSLVGCFPPAVQQPLLMKEISWRALTNLALNWDPARLLSLSCSSLIDKGYLPAVKNILWADTLVRPPTQNGKYIQSVRSTSMHLLVDDGNGHFIDAVRKSQHCSVARGATVFEDNHKRMRQKNVQSKGALNEQRPIWEQLVITATAESHATLEGNQRLVRLQQKRAEKAWTATLPTLQRDLLCLALVRAARSRVEAGNAAELVVDADSGACTLRIPTADMPDPAPDGWVEAATAQMPAWHTLLDFDGWASKAGTWNACPDSDAWTDGTVPSSPLCIWDPRANPSARRVSVTGKCGGNHNLQGQPDVAQPDVECQDNLELRASDTGRTTSECCKAKLRTGKCLANTDSASEPDVVCPAGQIYRKNVDSLSRGKDARLHVPKCCKAGPRGGSAAAAPANREPDEDDSEPEDIDMAPAAAMEDYHDEQQIEEEQEEEQLDE